MPKTSSVFSCFYGTLTCDGLTDHRVQVYAMLEQHHIGKMAL